MHTDQTVEQFRQELPHLDLPEPLLDVIRDVSEKFLAIGLRATTGYLRFDDGRVAVELRWTPRIDCDDPRLECLYDVKLKAPLFRQDKERLQLLEALRAHMQAWSRAAYGIPADYQFYADGSMYSSTIGFALEGME